jgi:hypothetical protein
MIKIRLLFLLGTVLLSLGAVSCMPRCPIDSCQVRMRHRHGETEYRGQPIYKKQNPKYGEKLPKQRSEKEVKRNSRH